MTKPPLSKESKRKIARFWIYVSLLMLAVIVILGVALGPITCGIKYAQQSSSLQTAHAIGLALYSYANDHGGKYPDGKTSTEVFQQLLDQGYVTDPALFFASYMRVSGKVPPTGNVLRSENVSWDVTGGADTSASDELPLLFLTGYKITYVAGAPAVLSAPPPKRTWGQWWDDVPAWEPFMAFYSKGNFAKSVLANSDGQIPNFIPADFDPKGKTYRQLTP